ncbi:MAG: alpha/beta hydrolase-fold protein [Pseudomonadota bacterium]|nr:alpha/beta hydrolase-fold protein [Pseudomonadota bacterium]
MEREVRTWWSPNVGREMGVARYGHFGKPVLFFPTGGGDYLDCERFLMVRALTPLLAAGRIKLYAIDSTCRQSWTNPDVPPLEKSHMQARYDRWLTDELVPWIRSDCGGTDQKFAACGASIGAYHALNLTCKHPEIVDTMVGMSGTYAMDRRMAGQWNEDWYYNDPLQFVPTLDGERREALARARFVLGLGRDHENPAYTWRTANMLGAGGFWNRVETWGAGSGHDWPTWRAMLPTFLDRLV